MDPVLCNISRTNRGGEEECSTPEMGLPPFKVSFDALFK